MTFILSLIALGVVVMVHEMGHMLMAKRANVPVLEFAVGMGPKLIRKTWNGTEYSIRLFPIGGMVKLAGMTPDDTPDVPPDRWFINQPIAARFWTLFGGPLFNVVFGFVLIVMLIKVNGTAQYNTVVDQIVPESNAHGILIKGDKIQSIDGQPVVSVMDIKALLKSNTEEVLIGWQRSGEMMSARVRLMQINQQAHIGVKFEPPTRKKVGIVDAVYLGAVGTVDIVKRVGSGLKDLILGSVSLKELSGPVGIIQVASLSLNVGVSFFINIMAVISMSLGLFNLIPIPLLDGGHIMLLGLEKLRGKKISTKTEVLLGKVAISILLSLMIFGLINDILNWTNRSRMFDSIQLQADKNTPVKTDTEK